MESLKVALVDARIERDRYIEKVADLDAVIASLEKLVGPVPPPGGATFGTQGFSADHSVGLRKEPQAKPSARPMRLRDAVRGAVQSLESDESLMVKAARTRTKEIVSEELAILKTIKEYGGSVQTATLLSVTGLAYKDLKTRLRSLRDQGRVKCTGLARATRWSLLGAH